MTAKKHHPALPFEGFVPYYAPHNLAGSDKTNRIENGMREGVWVFLYPDKSLRSAGRYLHNKRHGFWEEYCRFVGKNGPQVLYETGYYRNGTRVGSWSVRYLSTEEWGYDDATLEENELSSSNALEDPKNQYVGEHREGPWVITFSNGELRHTGRYRHGKRHGKWKEIRQVKTRRKGVRLIQRIGHYRDGTRVGSWEIIYLGTKPWDYEDEYPPETRPKPFKPDPEPEDTGGELR